MTSKTDADPKIEDALRAIADGAPVAWRELEASPAVAAELDSLHLLDDVAAAFRTDSGRAPLAPRKVLFRWGGLEIEHLLGEGSYGQVYRAFDPWLGRAVALKLLRTQVGGNGLDEARRLARLRHRNVLSVYGCGVHDDRAGLWSELIEGRTLSGIVAADGALSAEETARIGRDLAQALGVVHAVGLVHGDVKAENVMRESGGRIVLMDFGAGGDARLLAGQRLISGTPRYLPPEVLDGAPLGVSSDIYALGVLLFLLLSGRYPYQAIDAAALREEQRRNDRPRLPALRPDIEAPLCALIEGCLAVDPAQRPADAHQLASDFADRLHARVPAASRRLPLVALAAACAALLATAVTLIWPRLAPPVWDSTAQFLRVESAGDVELAANASLRIGDHLRLRLRSSRNAWVYVLNEDAAGNATVLYPLANNAPNLQHAGGVLTLPGGDGSTLAWEVTADSSREEFLVIASLAPQPELENLLAGWRHVLAAPNGDKRSVGMVVDAPVAILHGEHLKRLLALLHHDTQHVRVWQFRFQHAG